MKKKIRSIIPIIILFIIFNAPIFTYTSDNIKYITTTSTSTEEEIIPIIDITSFINIYQNDDILAYLNIYNTNIQTPVVQTQDNSYYLKHDLYKNNNIFGAVFMDYRINIYDKKILIYGHNAQNKNSLFTELENYYDEEYYNTHNIIELTSFNTYYRYEIFSVFIEPTDWSYMKINLTDDDWLEQLNMFKNKSWYSSNVELTKDDEIIIIQTCSFHSDYASYKDKYLLIIGKKILKIEY